MPPLLWALLVRRVPASTLSPLAGRGDGVGRLDGAEYNIGWAGLNSREHDIGALVKVRGAL